MKKCCGCKIEKELVYFTKNKSKKVGLNDYCKDCQKSYRVSHKDNAVAYSKKYRSDNSDKLAQKDKEYYLKNRQRLLDKQKKYQKNNQEKINIQRRNRRRRDVVFRIAESLRNRLRKIIKDDKMPGSAVRDMGCSLSQLKQHLESKFYPNAETNEQMTWDNYGFNGWHIDHIVPLSSFDLSNRNEFLKACNYKNLQPLWAQENLIKGNKLKYGDRLNAYKVS